MSAEIEDPEWRRQAEAEPYRIAYILYRRVPWHVIDVFTDKTVAGPYRTRNEALAAAARLNAQNRLDRAP